MLRLFVRYTYFDFEFFSPIERGAGVDVGSGVAVAGTAVGTAVGAAAGTVGSASGSEDLPHPEKVRATAVLTVNNIFIEFFMLIQPAFPDPSPKDPLNSYFVLLPQEGTGNRFFPSLQKLLSVFFCN